MQLNVIISLCALMLRTSLAEELLLQGNIRETVISPLSASLSFSSSWQVLGPFQIGTREAAWTADPLEKHGSFTNLSSSIHPFFPSSLAPQARATWSSTSATLTSSRAASADLHISFPEVQWSYLRLAYGWSSTQWQAWIRGTLNISQPETVSDNGTLRVRLWAIGPIEIVINGQRFWGGDFYGFNQTPMILHLNAGVEHKIEARVVRDVRSMGGIDEDPAADVKFRAEVIDTEESLEVRENSAVLPDVVEGNLLAGGFGGLSVTNVGREWLEVVSVRCDQGEVDVRFWEESFTLNAPDYPVAPGQTRALSFTLRDFNYTSEIVPLQISYKPLGSSNESRNLKMKARFRRVGLHNVQKITYMHPGGIVSYSMLRPPSKTACSASVKQAPILLLLHGAGVEADNPVVRESFDELPDLCAWVLLPSGVTTWSGDDWHIWGQRDVNASKEAISQWIKLVNWSGVGVDHTKVLVSGHSNGGQGVWHTLTHQPDNVLAAVPASGYLSISLYVPFTFWRPMDSRKRAILEAATASYRHDLLAPNFKGVPVFQQHGSNDDNVPAYHSRLMHELIDLAGYSSNYSELKGKGHWWQGVMTTDQLKKFYEDQFTHPKTPSLAGLRSFEIVVSNPSDLSGRFGLVPLYVQDPGQIGRIRVHLDDDGESASIEVQNILAFKINKGSEFKDIAIIDSGVAEPTAFAEDQETRVFYKKTQEWHQDATWSPPRSPEQFLGVETILKTVGPIPIRVTDQSLMSTAVQIANNFHQYFSADSVVINQQSEGYPHYRKAEGFQPSHTMTLGVGHSISPGHSMEFPIMILPNLSIQIRDGSGRIITPVQPGKAVGALFIRPSHSGIELVVWGSDQAMFEQAARLIPMLTGTGQPDFIILTEEARWKGVEGSYLGFFDAFWQVSKSSVLP